MPSTATSLSEFLDLLFDVFDLESSHGAVDRLHGPLEDRQSGPVAAAIAHSPLDHGLGFEAEFPLVELPRPLDVGHGQGGNYTRIGEHRTP